MAIRKDMKMQEANERQFQLIKEFLISVFLTWLVGALFNMDFTWLATKNDAWVLAMAIIALLTGVQHAVRNEWQ